MSEFKSNSKTSAESIWRIINPVKLSTIAPTITAITLNRYSEGKLIKPYLLICVYHFKTKMIANNFYLIGLCSKKRIKLLYPKNDGGYCSIF